MNQSHQPHVQRNWKSLSYRCKLTAELKQSQGFGSAFNRGLTSTRGFPNPGAQRCQKCCIVRIQKSCSEQEITSLRKPGSGRQGRVQLWSGKGRLQPSHAVWLEGPAGSSYTHICFTPSPSIFLREHFYNPKAPFYGAAAEHPLGCDVMSVPSLRAGGTNVAPAHRSCAGQSRSRAKPVMGLRRGGHPLRITGREQPVLPLRGKAQRAIVREDKISVCDRG